MCDCKLNTPDDGGFGLKRLRTGCRNQICSIPRLMTNLVDLMALECFFFWFFILSIEVVLLTLKWPLEDSSANKLLLWSGYLHTGQPLKVCLACTCCEPCPANQHWSSALEKLIGGTFLFTTICLVALYSFWQIEQRYRLEVVPLQVGPSPPRSGTAGHGQPGPELGNPPQLVKTFIHLHP